MGVIIEIPHFLNYDVILAHERHIHDSAVEV